MAKTLNAALLACAVASPLLAGDSVPALRTATTHPMKYHLALPQGWTAGKTFPVAVLIPDAGRDFEGNLAAFVKARGALPYILVAPHVVTSGGANYRLAGSYRYSEADWKNVAEAGDWRFDEEGIAAVLADVRALFGGEEKAFLTGWEAGGHTVWAYTFRHPDRLRAAALVSTNWRGRWVADADWSSSPARTDLPVKVLFCDRSKVEYPVGWDAFLGQTRDAMKLAEAHGFGNVTFESAPGRPHGPLADEVVAFFESVRARKP
jgi:pimeloyl-ACP methyl ester carboxylesterase